MPALLISDTPMAAQPDGEHAPAPCSLGFVTLQALSAVLETTLAQTQVRGGPSLGPWGGA